MSTSAPGSAETLVAEDLLLLLLEDDSGKLRHASFLEVGVGGALLVELALAGSVVVQEPPSRWSKARVVPAPGSAPPPDQLLAQAWSTVAEKPRSAQDLVARLGKGRRDPLLERLATRGVLRREQDRVLGLFPRTRWPAADQRREAAVRQRLDDALVHGVTPDDRTAALVALLSALQLAPVVLDRGGLSSREMSKRAERVAEGDWAAEGVRDAVKAAQAAVVAATVVATTAATTSGSS